MVDRESIDYMLNNYLNIFMDIPKTVFNNNIITQPVKLESDNIIIYKKLTDEHYIAIIILFIPFDSNNESENSVIKVIVSMFSTIFEDSVGSNILNQENVVDYTLESVSNNYDNFSSIFINVELLEENLNTVAICYNIILQFIEYLKKITQDDFLKIYLNFYKQSLYNFFIAKISINDDFLQNVVQNMFVLDESKKNCVIIFKDYIDCCESNNFAIFKKIVSLISVKIITNCDFEKQNNVKIMPYYNTKYIKSNIEKVCKNLIGITINNKYIFNANNLIGIDNFNIKVSENDEPNIPENYSIKKFSYKNKFVYVIEAYEKQIMNVIQLNFFNVCCKTNILVVMLYIAIVNKILLFYINTMINYALVFKKELGFNYIIMKYSGLENLLCNFIEIIKDKIDINGDYFNNNLEKYFENAKIEIKNNIVRKNNDSNLFSICHIELLDVIKEEISSDEKILFINNLTINNFKKIIKNLFCGNDEIVIISGYNKNVIAIFNNKNDNFLKHNLDNTTLTKNNLDNTMLTNTLLTENNLTENNLTENNLTENNLDNKMLTNTLLTKNNLTKNNLNNTMLTNTLLTKNNLTANSNYIIKCPQNTILSNTENQNNCLIMYAVTKPIILNEQTHENIRKTYNCFKNVTSAISKLFFTQVREYYNIGYVSICDVNYCKFENEQNETITTFVIEYMVQSVKSPVFVRDCILDFNKNICNNIDNLIGDIFNSIDIEIEYLKNDLISVDEIQNIIIEPIKLFNIRKINVKSDIIRMLESINEDDVRNCLNNLCNAKLKTYSCFQK